MFSNRLKKISVLLGVVAVLSACATKNKYDMTHDAVDGDIKWVRFEQKDLLQQGTFPDLDRVNRVQSGMSKTQLYDLLGTPHFADKFRARDWEYLFHFKQPSDGIEQIISCQYKIRFDRDYHLVEQVYWRTVYPENAECPPKMLDDSTQPTIIIREVAPLPPVRINQ